MNVSKMLAIPTQNTTLAPLTIAAFYKMPMKTSR